MEEAEGRIGPTRGAWGGERRVGAGLADGALGAFDGVIGLARAPCEKVCIFIGCIFINVTCRAPFSR